MQVRALDPPETGQLTVLVADGYGVSFGTRVILADLHFKVAAVGITVLMGPVGTGKSCLLRSVAGLNNPSSIFRQWGRVEYQGQILSPSNCPALVQQQIHLLNKSVYQHLIDGMRGEWHRGIAELRLHVEEWIHTLDLSDLVPMLEQASIDLPTVWQRIVTILSLALTHPGLLMIDEPTSALRGADEELMLKALTKVATKVPSLVVLHNQKQARRIASHILLLAGGRIQAQCDATTFFDHPPTAAAQDFVRTGSCHIPSPDASVESLAEDVPPPPALPLAAQLAVRVSPDYRGPNGFRWILPGRLAGTPMPGVVQSVDQDLAALRTVGITQLITLTENDISQEALHRHGLRNLHLPIRDREPPTLAQVRMLLTRINTLLKNGEVVAVHCLAGLGRTGTILASWLIHEGLTASAALERIRKVEPGYVQSASQEEFLASVEADILRRIPTL